MTTAATMMSAMMPVGIHARRARRRARSAGVSFGRVLFGLAHSRSRNRASLSSVESWPSSSIDSNSGGLMRLPEIAVRRAPNAIARFQPEPLDERRPKRRLDRRRASSPRVRRGPRLRHPESEPHRARAWHPRRSGCRRPAGTGTTSSAGASPSSCMRSCTSGVAASSRLRSISVCTRLPRYGSRRSASSAVDSSRMWSPLIDSAFFRSNRAGFGLTFATSNAATISSIENTSRSALSDQPSSAR